MLDLEKSLCLVPTKISRSTVVATAGKVRVVPCSQVLHTCTVCDFLGAASVNSEMHSAMIGDNNAPPPPPQKDMCCINAATIGTTTHHIRIYMSPAFNSNVKEVQGYVSNTATQFEHGNE